MARQIQQQPRAAVDRAGRRPAGRASADERLAARIVVSLIAWSLLLPAATHTASAQESAGVIRGTVYDVDFDPPIPLPRVRVTIVELGASTTASDDGNFLFESVPAGTYSLSLFLSGYERGVLSGVVVTGGQLTDVRGELTQEVIDMPVLVVSGDDLLGGGEVALLEIRQMSLNLQDAISSELIGKAGASDVADALKMVVGASVVEGKYATVRGLSDRYTGTTLNGIRVPSADPRRRAVQIDLFPTGTIDSLTVTKNFTPDLQGDFTGGGVDIRTKKAPEKYTLSFSYSAENNDIATGEDGFLTYRGGGVDLDGSDRGRRDVPSIAKGPLPNVPQPVSNPTPENIADALLYDELTRSFAPSMGVSNPDEAPGPGQSFLAAGGNRWELPGGGDVGLIGSLTYSHKYDLYLDGQNRQGGVSDPGVGLDANPRSDSLGTESLLIGALVAVEWKLNQKTDLSWDLILNQSEEDQARIQVEDISTTQEIRNQALRFVERTVASAQMHGGHTLTEKLDLSWDASYNFTRQAEPDVRFFRDVFDRSTNSASFAIPGGVTESDVTRRIFRDGEEDNLQAKADLEWTFPIWADREAKLKGGIYGDSTDREYDQRSFTYTFPTQLGSFFGNSQKTENQAKATFAGDSPDDLWTDVFLDPDRIGLSSNRCVPPDTPFTFGANCAAENQLLWTLRTVGGDVDYTGDQTILAGYAMVEMPVLEHLELTAGARWEGTEIGIVPSTTQPCQSLDSPTCLLIINENPPGSGNFAKVEVTPEQGSADIDERLWLPSVGVAWEIIPGMKLRGAASRTIARPTFRELAPVVTEEFVAGDQFVGNPFLALSTIKNFDVRWEWFRRPGEVLAASAFYKEIRDPIEYIAFGVGGETTVVQPVNFPEGRLAGFELEARVELDILADWLKGLAVGANYSVLDSEVDIPPGEQEALASFGLEEETRPLSGQPEYLVNASITYDNADTGTSVGLFYNLIGETLLTGAAVGADTGGQPNVFEDRVGSFDVTFSQRLGKGWSVSLKGKNLTGEPSQTFWRYEPRAPLAESEVIRAEHTRATRLSLGFKWTSGG